MGKSDFLTPKAIGNRIKAKGLQKLRWFCQVCQKQCRDENGFKCHTSSESHQRQMLIVANNPDKFLSEYSDEFERSFLESLRRRHGTKRMAANVVYNEYIADKLHIHMNATQWTTLGTFVQYLGRTGKCVVDETEKGWFMQYIDRDPRTLARQEEMDKKHKAELDHEERNRLFIERQLKVAKEGTSEQDGMRPTKMQRREGDEKVTLSLKSSTNTSSATTGKDNSNKATASKSQPLNVFAFGDATSSSSLSGDHHTNGGGGRINNNSTGNSTKRRAIDALTHEFEERHAKEQDQKQRRDQQHNHSVRQENWITTGIIVKVMNKKVANGDYYKLKGEIIGVKDRFGATVEMLDSRDVLQLDQDDLETVIPKVGRRVKIVNGVARGSVAKLLAINVDDFCVSLRIDSGSRRGDVLDRVEYEDVSRLADDAQPHERR